MTVMRHEYTTSEETIRTFSGHVKAIAEEANVSTKHIYGILAGTHTDPFAPFEHYYAAAVRSGAPTHHWEMRLAAIRERYKPSSGGGLRTAYQMLLDKHATDAETTQTLLEMLEGGLTPAEAAALKPLVDREQAILDELNALIARTQAAGMANGNGGKLRSVAGK